MNAAEFGGVLNALSDPTRRNVVHLLRHGPCRAGKLAEALDMTPPALSRHLRVLLTRGVIEDERSADDARVRMFRLRHEPFEALQTWLDQVETFWNDQLGSFKVHTESQHDRRLR